MIDYFSWKTLKIPLVRPFKIAPGAKDSYQGVILKICSGDICGFGESSPSRRVTGETVDSVVSTLSRIQPLLMGKEIEDMDSLFSLLGDFSSSPSALAAVDFALYDLWGKIQGKSIYEILGSKRSRMPTSFTVDMGDVDYTVSVARELISMGIKVLKLKVGGDVDEDIDRLRAIREIEDVTIRVDGNEGYTVQRARKFLQAAERYDLELMEQPLPRGMEERVRELKDFGVPIIADESFLGVEDIPRLSQYFDGINIKMMKCGGIHNARKIYSMARERGMRIMVGCMIETKLGISAATQFSLGMGVDYADLDGYWTLSWQPFSAELYQDGFAIPPEGPGLGVRPSSQMDSF